MNVVKRYRNREWKITGGLVPGYGGGVPHTKEELEEAHLQFVRDLSGRKMPAYIWDATSGYGFTEAGGSVTAQKEAGWIAWASLHAEHGSLSDEEVIDQLLKPLAERLALAAEQTRVYIMFGEDTIILEVPRPEGAIDHRNLGRATS